MQPFLPWEFILYTTYLKTTPIRIDLGANLLMAMHTLQGSPAPLNIPVNMFRQVVGATTPHPDPTRGSAMILDADVVKDGDSTVPPIVLQEAWDNLVANNKTDADSGALQARYPELYAATSH